jgi:hypothetical protein
VRGEEEEEDEDEEVEDDAAPPGVAEDGMLVERDRTVRRFGRASRVGGADG